MLSKNQFTQIFSIQKTFSSQNMGEELGITGEKDTKKQNKYRMKFLK
jgi:hypothetical protein